MIDESGVDPEAVPVRQGYARWSGTYDTQDNPMIVLEEPLVRSLLGDVRELAVADIGCGTGRHTLYLAESAARVTAVDFAPEMMAQAIGKAKGRNVRFVSHDLTEPFPFDRDSFDRVLCCLVLEHISGLDPVIAEMGRICRPGGFIVISELHPAMRLRRLQARFTDTETGRKGQRRELSPPDRRLGQCSREGRTPYRPHRGASCGRIPAREVPEGEGVLDRVPGGFRSWLADAVADEVWETSCRPGTRRRPRDPQATVKNRRE